MRHILLNSSWWYGTRRIADTLSFCRFTWKKSSPPQHTNTHTPPKPTTSTHRKINEMPHSFGIDKLNFRFRRMNEQTNKHTAHARSHARSHRACVTACTHWIWFFMCSRDYLTNLWICMLTIETFSGLARHLNDSRCVCVCVRIVYSRYIVMCD